MKLELRQALSQNLEQRIAIQQVMLTGQVLSLPVGAVDVLLTAIASNPEKVENMIESSGTDPRHSEHSMKSFYSGLVGSGESRGQSGHKGTITTFTPKNLAELFEKEAEMPAVPDVIYSGRENDKPGMEFAQHLSPRPELSFLMIPSRFEKTASLYSRLIKEREWISKTLRNMYTYMGEEQREFLYSLRFTNMNIFDMEDVAEKLEISASNVSRLRKGRLAKVGNIIFDAKLLMPTQAAVYKYKVYEMLNRILNDEVESGAARGAPQIGGITGIPTRTISKYLNQEGIPNTKERIREYEAGKTEAYHIPETLLELVSRSRRE